MASTRGRDNGARTFDSASADRNRSKSPTRTSATIARSFGSPSGRKSGPGAGGHSRRIVMAPNVSTWPACASTRCAWSAASAPGRPRCTYVGQPAPPSSTSRVGNSRITSSAMPSWSVCACVSTSPSRRFTPASWSRLMIGPPGGPVSTNTLARPLWISVASPWPMFRKDTSTSPSRTGGGRCAADAPASTTTAVPETATNDASAIRGRRRSTASDAPGGPCDSGGGSRRTSARRPNPTAPRTP